MAKKKEISIDVRAILHKALVEVDVLGSIDGSRRFIREYVSGGTVRHFSYIEYSATPNLNVLNILAYCSDKMWDEHVSLLERLLQQLIEHDCLPKDRPSDLKIIIDVYNLLVEIPVIEFNPFSI